MRRATFSELQNLLTARPARILAEIDSADAQLSIPLDGQGVRVLVETRTDSEAERVPSSLRVSIGGELVDVPLEARATAQDYELLDTVQSLNLTSMQ